MPPADGFAATMADVGVVATALLAIATLAGLLWAALGGKRWWADQKAHRRFQRQFRADWMGTEDRPGVPGRPGVMAALADIRHDWTQMAERVRRTERDLLRVRSEVSWLMTRCRATNGGCAPAVTATEDERG